MSNFPISFDSDDNLYLVHDSLRLRLAEDYEPGDTRILVEEDDLFVRFPSTGIITLTEQCNEVSVRAVSYKYTSKGNFSFEGLDVLDGFTDTAKPKRITNVTQNVIAPHHNELKDALIAIEGFAGVKGEVASRPLAGSMEARTNFLRELVLQPKAWFSANKRIGIVPLCVDFKDFSTRDPDLWIWDFGDTTQVISRTESVSVGDSSKCYYSPGVYSVSLTASNDFGADTVTIPSYITARVEAPDEATITFTPTTQQILSGDVLRSRANQLISLMVNTTGQQLLDPITSWDWEFNDDISHDSSSSAKASYSIGGIYDVKLKANTELGAYRTTVFEDVIDVVEKFNIWHFIFDSTSSATTKTAYAYEFGLLSETYKSAPSSTALSVTRNAGFLTGAPNYAQQYREFRRNNGFAARNLTASGDHGTAVLFWAENDSTIRFREFNGFESIWTVPVLGSNDTLTRDWNWLALDSGSSIYFLLGNSSGIGSPTNQTFKDVGLASYALNDITFTTANYLNGAEELMNNVGAGLEGDFSVYRGTWKDSSGYFVRNDGAGSFFRLKSFYKTDGTISAPLQSIRKLTDMPGATKFEGQMLTLASGVYFFNNTGEVLLYNPTTNTWGVGGPGVASLDFAKLQDKDVAGYDSESNTLIAVSDQSSKAYLFFDYSTRAQMKFNETDLTFTSLPVRPSGEQFMAGLY